MPAFNGSRHRMTNTKKFSPVTITAPQSTMGLDGWWATGIKSTTCQTPKLSGMSTVNGSNVILDHAKKSTTSTLTTRRLQSISMKFLLQKVMNTLQRNGSKTRREFSSWMSRCILSGNSAWMIVRSSSLLATSLVTSLNAWDFSKASAQHQSLKVKTLELLS